MTDFLLFFNDLRRRFPLHLEIYYSRTLDWCIKVWKMGCAKDYPNSPAEGKDAILVSVQDADMKLCFAKAQVALKEWMRGKAKQLGAKLYCDSRIKVGHLGTYCYGEEDFEGGL